ncbi:hypothetical protein C817_03637 [Dorea sp. 5-2]|jgi:NAD(P)-dependent dehydrogenase (short-subunit alcohol dehydrogenase family)|nr:hypothetical protein C817_03637 [Dorea sp. 5-2]MCI9023763.1 D-threitol dehydrogenase [Dorea sp.]
MTTKLSDAEFRLDHKVAVITGAASGIGLSISRMFAEKGASVCMVCLNSEEMKKAAESLPGAMTVQADISNPKLVSQAVEKIIGRFGRIDVLANCAGVGDIEWAKDMPVHIWDKVIAVNLSGTFYISQRIGKEMIRHGNGGKIISIASQAGIVSIDKHVAYSASKAGIISMTKSLAYEWGQYGIQVNAISPTATETPLIVGYWDVGKVHDDAIANTPAGRFCKPEEVAAAAVFLASESSNMITGANLVIDGGYTIH